MQKLIHGLHHFQKHVFNEQKDLFETLSKGQHPQALFITCSDSRINPNLITQTDPGDLFIIRNAGNIIPAHGPYAGGETATIEFALQALKVKDIVVCGHSHCGAIKGLLNPESLESLPTVKQWLTHAEATHLIIKESYGDLPMADQVNIAIQENVLVQIENLRTLPVVASKLTKGEVNLHAWVYKIETGEVFAYDDALGQFKLVKESLEYSSGQTERLVMPTACI